MKAAPRARLCVSALQPIRSRRPVKIAVVCLLVNLVLNLILMGPFKHVGIAMATVVSSWLNAGLLAYVLHKRGHFALDRRLSQRLPRIILASAGMTAALALALALTPLGGALAGSMVERGAALAALVVGGMAVFGALVWVTGAARPRDLKSLYRGPGVD